ncbi:alpha/beta fold hydrolase [Deinococcus sp.]|uniref:alpha/beta fold hydrolase n=1 Tax=Deinococcus sp. TaxID=47478 RepID=UPI0025F1C583|nr:alpha/beta fold hydrolase [Deinococcus sp.]
MARGDLRATLVYYPGARVKPEAYRWLGEALAPSGIQTVIVRFPLDLALLSPNRADDVLARLPAGEELFLAGHSLGGAVAAQYAGSNPSRIKGLILMGAYPANTVSLRDSKLRVLDLLAGRDGVATPQEVEAGLPRLPASTQLVRLPGAVHSYFGRYGPQRGDGTPAARPPRR